MAKNKSRKKRRATAPPIPKPNHELQILEESLEAKIPQLQNLPAPARLKLVREVQMSVQTISSPFPPPEFIQAYAEVLPDGAEKLIRASEKQANHRMELENYVIKEQQAQANKGQIFAFIIALVCIGASLTAALNGHETFAGILGSSTILGLVSAFIAGKKKQKDSLAQKSGNK